MEPTPESILTQVMQLPVEQRLYIANLIYESAKAESDIDPEIEAAWSDEISSRLRDIDEGKVELIPWEDVEKELREIVGDTE